MRLINRCFTILLLIIITACAEKKQKSDPDKKGAKTAATDTVKKEDKELLKNIAVEDTIVLTDDNAIPFFFEYGKKHKENKVRVTTRFGSFVIQLYEETPYHRANFIYLAKKGYFNGSQFHRVVKDFIIQGGNSDSWELAERRKKIGSYLLPPDTDKGLKHHRGTVSMPSSNVDNPHKFASPYEFFIVVTHPGSYHLDGDFTAFGKVIEGMDVVDKISVQPTDKGEWPVQSVFMEVEVIE